MSAWGLMILSLLGSFFVALLSPWRWGVVAFVVLPLLLERTDDDKPANYDSPTVGVELAIFIAGVSVILWLIGRWIRHRVRQVD